MNTLIRTSFQTKNFKELIKIVRNNRRTLSTETTNENSSDNKKGGYAKAFDKFEAQLNKQEENVIENRTFATLLKNSKFIDVRINSRTDNMLF